MEAKRANDRTHPKHRRTYRDMRGGDIGSFVTPDGPGSQANLNENTDQPGGGKSAERRNFPAMGGEEKPDHADGDQNRTEPMRHL